MNPMTLNKDFEKQLDFYPYGVQYYRAPTPLPGEWEADLDEIARIGYTHVQYRPQWRWHQKVRGKTTWDDLDCLFDLAGRKKLKVILKPMLETAPDWAFHELKGTRIGFHGVPISPISHGAIYVGGWLPCFDNPGVMSAALDFVRELVRRYRNHPALWFYDAWNEPRSKPLGQCQCVHSIQSYRQWLEKRYSTIENLNQTFGKGWETFETIMPPVSGCDHTEMFLWRQWAASAVAGHVGQVTEVIRSEDPKAFVMVHVGECSINQDAACDTSDDLLNARKVDRYGTSFPIDLYPNSPIKYANSDLISDWIRRVDPMYWCHEFYPNWGGWGPPPDPQVLNQLIWMAIAGGAAGFTYWQYRSERLGNEANGFGLREINGSSTPRSNVADRIADILKKHGDRLIGTHRAPSRIALLYSRQSDVLSRIDAMEDIEASHEKITKQYFYKQSIHNAHALYLIAGETVDWVIPGDDLSSYQIIHISAAEIIDSQLAKQLRNFVRNGGSLIVEYPFACRDENTWISPTRPTHGLSDLLGCREKDRFISKKPGIYDLEFTQGPKLSVERYYVDFELCGGKVLAAWKNNQPAAVEHSYGQGTVITLPPGVSVNDSDRRQAPAVETLKWLLEHLGLRQSQDTPQGVWIRKRVGFDHEIWFIFNMTREPVELTLPALPRTIWQTSSPAADQNRTISLPPHATWVAELPKT
jgi:beta-galactosidase GanA